MLAPPGYGIRMAQRLFETEFGTLEEAREASEGCKRCDLWKTGTQTVIGEGSLDAKLVLVGEQPGDKEDLEGRPFVGPAGRLLDEALEQAGIDRRTAYVTNVVKHFKWQPRGKRRIHQKPNAAEVAACRIWLDTELSLLQPDVLVCLGATAAQALLGRQFRVSKQRGVPVESDLAPVVMATVHPSAILRSDNRDAEMALFVEDLKQVAKALRAA
jgi:uracil-DNA glycosylase family protein